MSCALCSGVIVLSLISMVNASESVMSSRSAPCIDDGLVLRMSARSSSTLKSTSQQHSEQPPKQVGPRTLRAFSSIPSRSITSSVGWRPPPPLVGCCTTPMTESVESTLPAGPSWRPTWSVTLSEQPEPHAKQPMHGLLQHASRSTVITWKSSLPVVGSTAITSSMKLCVGAQHTRLNRSERSLTTSRRVSCVPSKTLYSLALSQQPHVPASSRCTFCCTVNLSTLAKMFSVCASSDMPIAPCTRAAGARRDA
mmetsp:Transcript_7299/g.23016  ORF Transcript_7299/g.23016 Transcript_7299/m.23016 type:complete len:253 (-) Transcript_7299:13-771(-)